MNKHVAFTASLAGLSVALPYAVVLITDCMCSCCFPSVNSVAQAGVRNV